MKNIYKSEQNGRSMIEMLGVLAIIGVLSVGGISGYSKAMAKFKVNKTLDQVSMLITNIRTMYGNSIDYTGLDEAQVINLDLAPQDMLKKTGTGDAAKTDLKNPFNGDVTVTAGTNNASFKIKYDGLDLGACVTIASSDWGGAPSSGLVSITAGTTAFSWTAGTLPISVATAAEACKVTAGGTTSIEWEYR